jgi:Ca2+-binding RTX toxin-like protein
MTLSSFTYAAAGVLVAPAIVVLLSSPAQARMPSQCGGLVPTIVGTYGDDELTGTAGDDVIVGGHGNDHIRGLSGNDVLCGNANGDRVEGGDGADRVYGAWGSDSLSGGPGDDVLGGGIGPRTVLDGGGGDDTLISWSPSVLFDYASAPQGVTVDLAAGTASGWGQDTLRYHPWVSQPRTGVARYASVLGSAYDDTLLGGPNPDELAGQGGADTIEGRGNTDYLFADVNPSTRGFAADHEADSIAGGTGDDWLVLGTAGTVSGGPGQDGIDLFASNVHPLAADLTIDGGDGPDGLTLTDESRDGVGVYRTVTFDMGGGSLVADGIQVTAVAIENFFARTAKDGDVSTAYDITGTDEANLIFIGGLDDDEVAVATTSGTVVVQGAGGDDVILSSQGDDTVDGGPGEDQADAQGGTDTCVSVEAGWYGNPMNCEVVQP